MTVEVHAVQRMRVYSEPTFATDYTGSIGSFIDVPFSEGTAQMVLTTDSLDPQQAVQSRVEGREEVLGKKSATLTFSIPLAPTGTAATTGQSAVSGALGALLKATFGGENLAAGSTSDTGSTATVVNVQAGHGSRWAAGLAMGWTNASGVLEVREVESVATDAVTLKYGFSGAPSSTDPLYNAATYYITEDPTETLQFYVQGYETSDKWLLLGGQAVGGVTFNIDVTGAALPSVSFNFTFAQWLDSSATAATPTMGTATYSNYSPIVGFAGECRSWVNGSPTYSASHIIDVSAFAWAPAISYIPQTSPSGTNTIKRWRGARANPPITGSFTTVYEDLTWWSARDNLVDRHIQYQSGIAAGNAFVLTAPTVQIKNPQRGDAGGLAGQTVEYQGRRDSDVASSTDALAKSPERVHLI